MYCIICGAKLETSEEICPLCGTVLYHPKVSVEREKQLYPRGRMPEKKHRSAAFNGAVIILFLIPIVVSFLADFNYDKCIKKIIIFRTKPFYHSRRNEYCHRNCSNAHML